MSCLGKTYIPIPPRVWYRVQNRCSLDDNDDYTTNQISYFADAEAAQMRNKGNVLQYKGNSSNLTKSQRFAKIARGQWTNRTITWATQSQTATNPNTRMLKRVGSVNVAINPVSRTIVETTAPLTCPQPQSVDTADEIVIQDGGSMLCNVQENVCTGATVVQPSGSICNPTSDSDVPGPIRDLCWRDGTPTWYPRQRLTMPTATTSWPLNAKFIRAAHM